MRRWRLRKVLFAVLSVGLLGSASAAGVVFTSRADPPVAVTARKGLTPSSEAPTTTIAAPTTTTAPPSEPEPTPTASAPTPIPTATPATPAPSPPPLSAPSNLGGQLAGLAGRAWNNQLAGLAANWANVLANAGTIYHQNLQAVISSPGWSGWQTLGENLWAGPPTATASEIHAAWMASPSHRANLQNPAFTAIGVACAVSGAFMACVQDFGG